MNLFRSCAVAMALSTALMTAPAHAYEEEVLPDPLYTVDAPPAYAMVGDLLIARPLLLAATAVGAAAFVISLPFSLLGGNVGEAAESLVVDPARSALVRCLGCTEIQQPAGAVR